jgi:glutathione S-transferase
MISSIAPIKVWGQGGPNPPKVAIILEELDIPHEIIAYPITDVKKPEYLAINPNGRLPAIQDPNTGITLWESGAILEYLIERYDPELRLSFAPGTSESYQARQWLFFQTTGQGPYYGQLYWFKFLAPEKVPMAVDRYVKEANRVTGVLEGWLAKQKQAFGDNVDSNGPWLVGNKLSFADLAFAPYQVVLGRMTDENEFNLDEFPHVKDWLEKITSREKVQKILSVAFKRD